MLDPDRSSVRRRSRNDEAGCPLPPRRARYPCGTGGLLHGCQSKCHASAVQLSLARQVARPQARTTLAEAPRSLRPWSIRAAGLPVGRMERPTAQAGPVELLQTQLSGVFSPPTFSPYFWPVMLRSGSCLINSGSLYGSLTRFSVKLTERICSIRFSPPSCVRMRSVYCRALGITRYQRRLASRDNRSQ